MPEALGAELNYLIAACLETDARRRIGSPANEEPLDWERLRRHAIRHRVEGVVRQRLLGEADGAVPPQVLATFDQAHRAQAFDYLAKASETVRLVELLRNKDYDSIVLKGCAVAQEYYAPNPEIRYANDVDVLVAPEIFSAADRLLRDHGYVRATPRIDMPASAESMARHLLDAYVYEHPARRIKVELHHRLLADPYVLKLPFDELLTRSVELRIGNGSLRGLGQADLAIYLCCHGAGHAFARLKWVADIARAFARLGEQKTKAALARARELRCGRSVELSLLLLHELAGVSFRSGSSQGALGGLTRGALRAIARDDRDRPLRLSDIPDLFHDLAYGLRLAETWPSTAFKLLQYLANQDDTRVLKLGVEWRLLYAVLGRPLALGRLWQRARVGSGSTAA